MAAPFEIADLAIDNVNWAAVTPPWDCGSIGIRNALAVDVKIKTDTAIDTIPAGGQDLMLSAWTGGTTLQAVPPLLGVPADARLVSKPHRFTAGVAVCYLQASSGSGTIKLRFLE